MFVLTWSLLSLLFSVVCSNPHIAIKAYQSQINCFQSDVTSNVITSISYKLEHINFKSKNKFNEPPMMRVEIYDPVNEQMLSRDYSEAGNIHFTSEMNGVHKICVTPTSQSGNNKKGKMKIYLDIQSVGADNYTAISLSEKYTNIQLELRKALDNLDLIARWHSYMIKREERFRKTTNSISWKIFCIGILQILMLVGLGYWQTLSLKNYFIAKKLV